MAIGIDVFNVEQALHHGVKLLLDRGRSKPSRNGATLEVPEPVVTTYHMPWQRVLLNPLRDANPFFHFFESLWMLAGRNDVEFVASMVKRMADFSDDGEMLHGAYGYRWRNWFASDQLEIIEEMLSTYPDDRRCVLQMWDTNSDLNVRGKDLPCNTHIYFKVREGALQMSVLCRSNDVLLGAYGANAVHFSMLQQYMAERLGLRMGPMTQFSDSYHVYTEGKDGEMWNRLRNQYLDGPLNVPNMRNYPSHKDGNAYTSMNADSGWFENDLDQFFEKFDRNLENRDNVMLDNADSYQTLFFKTVVLPMWFSYWLRDVALAETIAAPDWRTAAVQWISRRNTFGNMS